MTVLETMINFRPGNNMALTRYKRFKYTAFIRYFGWRKVAMIYYCRPRIVELNEDRLEVIIPLNRRTRNHVKSMYIGAMTVGVDLAVGLLAMDKIRETGKNIILIFKDFKADYLKRAEGDVHFICAEGKNIADILTKLIESEKRVNLPVKVEATVPSKFGNEVVAKFIITLSLKEK